MRAAVILGTNLALATAALVWLLARQHRGLAQLAASSPAVLLAFVATVAAGLRCSPGAGAWCSVASVIVSRSL